MPSRSRAQTQMDVWPSQQPDRGRGKQPQSQQPQSSLPFLLGPWSSALGWDASFDNRGRSDPDRRLTATNAVGQPSHSRKPWSLSRLGAAPYVLYVLGPGNYGCCPRRAMEVCRQPAVMHHGQLAPMGVRRRRAEYSVRLDRERGAGADYADVVLLWSPLPSTSPVHGSRPRQTRTKQNNSQAQQLMKWRAARPNSEASSEQTGTGQLPSYIFVPKYCIRFPPHSPQFLPLVGDAPWPQPAKRRGMSHPKKKRARGSQEALLHTPTPPPAILCCVLRTVRRTTNGYHPPALSSALSHPLTCSAA